MDWDNIFIGVILIAAALVAIILVKGAIDHVQTASKNTYLCQVSGYAGIVDINDKKYCYRLEGEGGLLKLVDSLKEVNDE